MQHKEKTPSSHISLTTIFIVLGVLCLVAAMVFYLYNKTEADTADAASNDVLNQLQDQTPLYNVPEDGIMPTILIDGYEYIGNLEIPCFGLDLPIQSKWSYDGLKIAPGRYYGSVWTNDMVIAGHNYERHFGNLRNLDVGETVIFTDVLNNVFTYEVVSITTLQPTAVDELISSTYPLTLFTCTPSGANRVTVRCDYVS